MTYINLQYGKTKAVIQTQGAQIASFRGADGQERIWQAAPAVWAQHAPVLFPVCGSVRDGRILIDGEAYPMTKHGFTREPDFEVFQAGEDYVDLVMTATDQTRNMYPFDFAFHVTYRLFENGYTTTFLIENQSTLHTVFGKEKGCLYGREHKFVPVPLPEKDDRVKT